MSTPLLEVDHLSVGYRSSRGLVKAVTDVTFDLAPGEFIGIAGESGSGKSTLLHAVARLLKPPAEVLAGDIRFLGTDWLNLPEEKTRPYRWKRLALVLQSAMSTLNPVLRIGEQFQDVLMTHDPHLTKKQSWDRARELLALVEVPADRVSSYPHELSGGMRQRTVIAMAMAFQPDLLILDEPTTALDVVVERSILETLKRLRDQFKFAVLFVTHDLALLLEMADRLIIMYAGRVVESARREAILAGARHPYSRGLVAAFPTLANAMNMGGIPGFPPDLVDLPPGCAFHPRCPLADEGCRLTIPPLVTYRDGGQAACFKIDPDGVPLMPIPVAEEEVSS